MDLLKVILEGYLIAMNLVVVVVPVALVGMHSLAATVVMEEMELQ
jgi:hypothetical protein